MTQEEHIAVLVSGGLDSAVLTADLARRFQRVQPLYIRHGLSWEDIELDNLRQFLIRLAHPAIAPLVILHLPVADIYGAHWSVTGQGVPDQHTDDSAVYLPGRNLTLLSKAAIWCSDRRIGKIALAPLNGNPFGDNLPEFYAAMETALGHALGQRFEILRPFSSLSKAEVIRRGAELPLELTFSCARPVSGKHCGMCNKCAERRNAFTAAGVSDPTAYSDPI